MATRDPLAVSLCCLAVAACSGLIGTPGVGEAAAGPGGGANAAGGTAIAPRPGGAGAAGGPAGAAPPGTPGAGSPSPGAPGAAGAAPGSAACAPGLAPAAAVSSLRRLTRFEYDRAVRDLLGDASRPAGAFLGDEKAGPFDANGVTPVSDLALEKYAAAAETVAANAVRALDRILPCTPAPGREDECAERFIAEMGKRVYRRPLAADEVARLRALYAGGKARGAFADGVRLVLQALLQSPHFLYHVEVGTPVAGAAGAQGLRALTPHEIAARLAFALNGTTPDAALLRAADAGGLRAPADIEREARRLLGAAPAREALARFAEQWLALDRLDETAKDPRLVPGWNASLRQAMRAESGRFFEAVLREGDGRLETLLGAPFTYASAPLLPLYGVADPGGAAGPDGLKRLPLDPRQRAGLLTQLGFLAVHSHTNQSSPVHRGVFVRERVLCQALPPPPDAADTTPPAPDARTSTRERFRQHRENESCAACHRLIDPVGFGFETFDLVGRHRAADGAAPVDASGEIVGEPADIAGPFTGPLDLIGKLARSEATKACVAQQWFRFALGRLEGPEDACSLAELRRSAGSAMDLRELVFALARTDAFRHVRVQP